MTKTVYQQGIDAPRDKAQKGPFAQIQTNVNIYLKAIVGHFSQFVAKEEEFGLVSSIDHPRDQLFEAQHVPIEQIPPE